VGESHLLAGRVLGVERRDLVAVIEVVEIHVGLPPGKRERAIDVNRSGISQPHELTKKRPRDERLVPQ
jgi:hypothetical protein